MEVHPVRQLTERLIALHPIDELIHVIARRELQLSDQLPIGRMLNDDVDDLRSLIHDRIKLLTHLLRCVQDSDLSFAAGIGALPHISPRRGDDLRAGCADQCDVPCLLYTSPFCFTIRSQQPVVTIGQ